MSHRFFARDYDNLSFDKYTFVKGQLELATDEEREEFLEVKATLAPYMQAAITEISRSAADKLAKMHMAKAARGAFASDAMDERMEEVRRQQIVDEAATFNVADEKLAVMTKELGRDPNADAMAVEVADPMADSGTLTEEDIIRHQQEALAAEAAPGTEIVTNPVAQGESPEPAPKAHVGAFNIDDLRSKT